MRQNAFSLSDNLTWIKGGHTLKAGGLWTRNIARDGFGFGVNFRGQYRFNGSVDRQRLHRLPARAARSTCAIRSPIAGRSTATRTTSPAFVQDDWKINKSVTVFLGLRYEVVGAWHENEPDARQLHARPTAATTSSRTRRWQRKLPPGLIALGRTLTG